MKLSTLSYCLLSFCLSANLCYAAPEGGVVTDGPLTSLDKLETSNYTTSFMSINRGVLIVKKPKIMAKVEFLSLIHI